ncbi:MAG: helix-turn-helix transcriptional regulator [Hyphomonadaceae bacterium]|nr:helix-turn-helix transcriptional regulator [Hyphomonadaceae bacterium]
MRHQDIWRGIDGLAERNALTPSGLARLAGLDPTAFNPSKRFGKDGRPRWPSTESVAAALSAVGIGFNDFATLVDGNRGSSAPLLGLAEAGQAGYFDDAGFPQGEGWDEVRFPGLGDEPVYALEISGNSMQPTYRPGDRIVVAPSAAVRRGDRVVVKTRGGEVMAKELGRRSEKRIELLSLNPEFPAIDLTPTEILWLARIIWVSQ